VIARDVAKGVTGKAGLITYDMIMVSEEALRQGPNGSARNRLFVAHDISCERPA